MLSTACKVETNFCPLFKKYLFLNRILNIKDFIAFISANNTSTSKRPQKLQLSKLAKKPKIITNSTLENNEEQVFEVQSVNNIVEAPPKSLAASYSNNSKNNLFIEDFNTDTSGKFITNKVKILSKNSNIKDLLLLFQLIIQVLAKDPKNYSCINWLKNQNLVMILRQEIIQNLT